MGTYLGKVGIYTALTLISPPHPCRARLERIAIRGLGHDGCTFRAVRRINLSVPAWRVGAYERIFNRHDIPFQPRRPVTGLRQPICCRLAEKGKAPHLQDFTPSSDSITCAKPNPGLFLEALYGVIISSVNGSRLATKSTGARLLPVQRHPPAPVASTHTRIHAPLKGRTSALSEPTRAGTRRPISTAGATCSSRFAVGVICITDKRRIRPPG